MQTIWINGPFGVRFFVRVNEDEAVSLVDQVKSGLSDLKPFFKQQAGRMRKSFAENFFQGGRPDKWAPLSQGTIAGKNKNPSAVYGRLANRIRVSKFAQMHGGVAKRSTANILILTGALRDSYVEEGSNHVEQVSQSGLVIGSQDPKAAFHEYGTGLHGPNRSTFTIRPIRAKSLRFFTHGGGTVFAKSVQNPGVPARPVAIIQDQDIDGAIEDAYAHLLGDTP
jgi:phage gpG-like protein